MSDEFWDNRSTHYAKQDYEEAKARIKAHRRERFNREFGIYFVDAKDSFRFAIPTDFRWYHAPQVAAIWIFYVLVGVVVFGIAGLIIGTIFGQALPVIPDGGWDFPLSAVLGLGCFVAYAFVSALLVSRM